MNVQRCPECGQRLSSNYCDICMKKVPFGGVMLAKRRDPWDSKDGSSAHRMEKDHECISFEKPEKRSFRPPVKKQPAANKKKTAPALALILAVISLLPSLFGIIEDSVGSEPVPEPEYNIQEGFVEAGELGAENVPAISSAEIYNANGIRITMDDAGLSYGDYAVFFTIHNDTEDQISVNFENVSVNGFMFSFGAWQEVRAGHSEQLMMVFYDYELGKASITQVSEIAFELFIYNADDYQDIVTGELITLKTDVDMTTESVVDTSGLELYNDGSFRVVLRNIMPDGFGDYQMDLYMENLSGSSVNVYNGQILVNGEEVSGYFWKLLRPDTRAIDSGYLYELDEEVSEMNEITIDVYVDYMDGMNVVETISEKITFSPGEIF